MKKIMMWLITGIAAAAMTGCCGKRSDTASNRICAQGVSKQAVMDASQKVLENMHFTIEKADSNAGYVSTRPLAAGQFFEFWRSDTVGCYNFAEDNLHSVTRSVEINVIPQGEDFCVECKVNARRLSIPTREVSTATELPRVFTKSTSGLQTTSFNKEQQKGAVWVNMGPDPQLQARILERIGKQISRTGQ